MSSLPSIRYRWAGTIIMIASLLSSCMLVRNPIPCDEIREDALRTLPFGAATMPEVGEWVITTYQVDETSVMEQQNQLSWNLPNRSFTARFEDDILRRVIVYWSMGPTVEEIIDCLGTPEYYEATIKRDIRPRFDFVLWYPSSLSESWFSKADWSVVNLCS